MEANVQLPRGRERSLRAMKAVVVEMREADEAWGDNEGET